MEVMNTPKENSNSPQHPAPQHGLWQGEMGKGLEEESIARSVPTAGVWTSSTASLSIRFGVCCEGRGLFAVRQTSCSVTGKGVCRISSPRQEENHPSSQIQGTGTFLHLPD